MEDVDSRIPVLTDECQVYLAVRDRKRQAKLDMEESLDKIGKLLHENDLNLYVVNGEKFYEEPGSPSIKVVKVRQNG
jgi:hypothetical protein